MMPSARFIDLVVVLTQKELKSRYKNLGLGYLWSLGNPLAYGLLYYLVFKFILKVQVDAFPLFLVSALFPWQWLTNSISVASTTFVSNSSLIKKVNFPRNLLALVVTAQDLFHFIAALPIIFVFMAVYHKPFSPILIIGIPLLCAIQILYTYSLGLLISTVNIFFRDLERLVGISITFLFYLTPIAYSVDMIPPKFQSYIFLNPLVPLILNWRNLFSQGTLDWTYAGISIAYGLGFFVIAQTVYRRLVWRFAEVL